MRSDLLSSRLFYPTVTNPSTHNCEQRVIPSRDDLGCSWPRIGGPVGCRQFLTIEASMEVNVGNTTFHVSQDFLDTITFYGEHKIFASTGWNGCRIVTVSPTNFQSFLAKCIFLSKQDLIVPESTASASQFSIPKNSCVNTFLPMAISWFRSQILKNTDFESLNKKTGHFYSLSRCHHQLFRNVRISFNGEPMVCANKSPIHQIRATFSCKSRMAKTAVWLLYCRNSPNCFIYMEWIHCAANRCRDTHD